MKRCKCFTRDVKGRSFIDEKELTKYVNKWLSNPEVNINVISFQIIPVAGYPGHTLNFIAFIMYEGIKK